jgi:hypothetical protein
MNNIKLIPLTESHKKGLWDILSTIPGYFDDKVKNRTMDEFFMTVIDALVGMKGKEIVGCAYLSDICNALGEINIFTKRHSVTPDELLRLIKFNIRYFFDKHGLKMLYAVTQCENKACIHLLKKAGFHWSKTLTNYETIRGKKVSGEMYIILREEVI